MDKQSRRKSVSPDFISISQDDEAEEKRKRQNMKEKLALYGRGVDSINKKSLT